MRIFVVHTGQYMSVGVEILRVFETLPLAEAFARSIGVAQCVEMDVSPGCLKKQTGRLSLTTCLGTPMVVKEA